MKNLSGRCAFKRCVLRFLVILFVDILLMYLTSSETLHYLGANCSLIKVTPVTLHQDTRLAHSNLLHQISWRGDRWLSWTNIIFHMQMSQKDTSTNIKKLSIINYQSNIPTSLRSPSSCGVWSCPIITGTAVRPLAVCITGGGQATPDIRSWGPNPEKDPPACLHP